MRLLTPALLLAAAACAPQDGLDPYHNEFAVPAGEEEEGNIASADDVPRDETLGVTNAAMGEDSDLLPPSISTVLMGKCARTSWVSGPLAIGGKRRELRCDMVSVAYLPRKPGYTDSEVQVLQKNASARFSLGTTQEAPDRLSIHTATLGDGETVKVAGECRGTFDRPPDSFFVSGGLAGLPREGDQAGNSGPEKRETLDCSVTDLQGNPIGAISFTSR